MPEVLLVNPLPPRGKGGKFRKRRSRKSSYKRNPVAANPRRRKRRRSILRARRFRRNPVSGNFLTATLMPSAAGAAGALGVDVLLGFLPLPATLKTGLMRPVVQGVAAVGLGMLAGMIAPRRIAEQVTAGALTVALYNTGRQFLQQAMPTLQLGQYSEYPALEYYNPVPVIEQEPAALSEFIDPMLSGNDEMLEGMGEGSLPGDLGEYLQPY